MTGPIVPETIYNNVLSKNMSKNEAIKLLISLIEESNDNFVRIKSIETISRLVLKNKKIFKTLENVLISDENPMVRAATAKVIACNFIKDGFLPLKWIIQKENSSIVLKTILSILGQIENKYMIKLRKELNEKIKKLSLNFGVSLEETCFLLSLGFDIIIYKAHPYSSTFKAINGDYIICVVKKGHIEALSFYVWKLRKFRSLTITYQV